MSAEESYQQAARCLQLAGEAPSAKLKGFLLAEAEAWTSLAKDQEWLERRSTDRRTLGEFPILRAVLSAHSDGAPNKPQAAGSGRESHDHDPPAAEIERSMSDHD